jgi:hypothetical protein
MLTRQLEADTTPVSFVFQSLDKLFSPWIVQSKSSSSSAPVFLILPWGGSPAELQAANHMVQTLIETIKSLKHDAKSVILASWSYIYERWDASPVAHVTPVIYSKAMQLPWNAFSLSVAHISSFQSLVETDLALYSPFILQILEKVDLNELEVEWLKVEPAARSELYSKYLRLLLTMCRNRSIVAMLSFTSVVAKSVKLQWHHVSPSDLGAIIDWISENCDATEVFTSGSSVCLIVSFCCHHFSTGMEHFGHSPSELVNGIRVFAS